MLCSLRFRLTYRFSCSEKTFTRKLKEAYRHKKRKNYEQMDRVHERNFQNCRLMIMLVRSMEDENK